VFKKIVFSLLVLLTTFSAYANIITGSISLSSSALNPSPNPIAHPLTVSWKFTTVGATRNVVSLDTFSLVIGNDVFTTGNTTWSQSIGGPLDIRGSGTSVSLFSAMIFDGGVELRYNVPGYASSFFDSGPSTEVTTSSPASVPVPGSLLLGLIGAVAMMGARGSKYWGNLLRIVIQR
jgi:hypothetical protein